MPRSRIQVVRRGWDGTRISGKCHLDVFPWKQRNIEGRRRELIINPGLQNICCARTLTLELRWVPTSQSLWHSGGCASSSLVGGWGRVKMDRLSLSTALLSSISCGDGQSHWNV